MRKIFFKNYQTIRKRIINSEVTYFFLIIQHLQGFLLQNTLNYSFGNIWKLTNFLC